MGGEEDERLDTRLGMIETLVDDSGNAFSRHASTCKANILNSFYEKLGSELDNQYLMTLAMSVKLFESRSFHNISVQ